MAMKRECPFCSAEFEVQADGRCPACHETVPSSDPEDDAAPNDLNDQDDREDDYEWPLESAPLVAPENQARPAFLTEDAEGRLVHTSQDPPRAPQPETFGRADAGAPPVRSDQATPDAHDARPRSAAEDARVRTRLKLGSMEYVAVVAGISLICSVGVIKATFGAVVIVSIGVSSLVAFPWLRRYLKKLGKDMDLPGRGPGPE
jgi:hypothetical protein